MRISNIEGSVVKSDDRYTVVDNTSLDRLVVSSTELLPNKSTSGHSHDDQEEVYYFVKGGGTMQLGDEVFEVVAGDVILIKGGLFHKVNAHADGCYFVCVFEGKRKH
jgi:quercetin dioxygenase-like cupin family protein|tara:strand:- start:346 stop:666 length:321 start_codon:yes stop_codon:yes gene_type:complete